MKLRQFMFSRPSKIIHTVLFCLWFPISVSLAGITFVDSVLVFTLIISVEAIYLELFLGDTQGDLDDKLDNHHRAIKDLLGASTKEVKLR